MDNETKEKATALAGEALEKAVDIWSKCAAKIGALWKSGIKGKVICIVGVLMILGIIGAFTADEEGAGGSGGGGGDWEYNGKEFWNVFIGFPKDEGEVYLHQGWGGGIKVMQATKKGNLVTQNGSDRVIWVESNRRYEDDEQLDEGYYIRRGSMEYTTAFGAEKTVARYVEVTGSLLAKVKKQIEKEKASAEAKAKAETEAKAKAKAERKAANANAKAEIAAMQAGKTAGETTTITLPGGVAMEMVWCPPGTFTMECFWIYGNKHRVTLTKGFWVGKTEVTQAQWKSVMGNNPSENKGDDLPVECVSWEDCQEFCENMGLQLPTEVQWVYACLAGSKGYAGVRKLDKMGWVAENSGGKTHPVGTKQPNAWGLYDMYGNVAEWCADWYYYSEDEHPSGAMTDPKGPSSGEERVCRGGSFFKYAEVCTLGKRGYCDPSDAGNALGFRFVRTLSE